MKKIFTIIAVALTLCAATANAQVKFGVKAGLNLTNMTIDGDLAQNLDCENQAGFFAGPTVKFTLPIVGLGVDASALYNQKQTKINDTKIKEQSIAIPVNARYSLPVLPLFIFAGPQFDFAIGDKKFDINSISEYKLKDSNVSINAGVGLTLGGLQATVNYNIACGKTSEFNALQTAGNLVASPFTGESKQNSWQIALAYYF